MDGVGFEQVEGGVEAAGMSDENENEAGEDVGAIRFGLMAISSWRCQLDFPAFVTGYGRDALRARRLPAPRRAMNILKDVTYVTATRPILT